MNLFIDNKSGAPIYEQLYTQIKNQILSGELQPEEAMPSIRRGSLFLQSCLAILNLKSSIHKQEARYEEVHAVLRTQ